MKELGFLWIQSLTVMSLPFLSTKLGSQGADGNVALELVPSFLCLFLKILPLCPASVEDGRDSRCADCTRVSSSSSARAVTGSRAEVSAASETTGRGDSRASSPNARASRSEYTEMRGISFVGFGEKRRGLFLRGVPLDSGSEDDASAPDATRLAISVAIQEGPPASAPSSLLSGLSRGGC